MPIYEYRCARCGSRFERIVFRASDELECPECRSRELEQQISSFAVQAAAGRPPEPSCPCGAAERGMCRQADRFA